MKKLSVAVLCLAACFSLTGRLQATCPVLSPTNNPLYYLNNTTWSFQTQDGLGDATIGVFTLTVGPIS